jgi:hypothetical protein
MAVSAQSNVNLSLNVAEISHVLLSKKAAKSIGLGIYILKTENTSSLPRIAASLCWWQFD